VRASGSSSCICLRVSYRLTCYTASGSRSGCPKYKYWSDALFQPDPRKAIRTGLDIPASRTCNTVCLSLLELPSPPDVLCRTAIDINLHRVALFPDATTALPPWLLRSMIRTWLLTTVTDRTLSAQLGKPSSMRGENSVQRYLSLLYGYIEDSKKAKDHQAVLDDSAVALWAVRQPASRTNTR
jgi:hypothetical protein